MPKPKPFDGQTCPEAFQVALDAMDVIGRWEWDAVTDLVRSDAFVALLFNLDPEEAETGAPLSSFTDSVHDDDRDRVIGVIRRSAQEGNAYLIEYRVHSADGITRWVLARGRFFCGQDGQPVRGSGILVDITRMRMTENAFGAANPNARDPPLERAAEHVIAAQQEITKLQDPDLKSSVDKLLMNLGRRLAQQEMRNRRRRMN